MADGLGRQLLRDGAALLRLSPVVWLDLLRATMELALARYRLGAHSPKQLLKLAQQNSQQTPTTSQADHFAARVAFAIPRVAVRLPWRADCWIQAMAAQRWLRSKGIASQLTIGTRKDLHGAFQAHAWLTCNGAIITGGDSSGYVPLVTPESKLPR